PKVKRPVKVASAMVCPFDCSQVHERTVRHWLVADRCARVLDCSAANDFSIFSRSNPHRSTYATLAAFTFGTSTHLRARARVFDDECGICGKNLYAAAPAVRRVGRH